MSKKETHPIVSESGSNPLDQAASLIKQVVAIVGTPPALTAKDRARAPKLRKGGETVIPTVAALSDQFGLTVTSYPTATMAANAKQAASLIPLHKQLVALTKQVEDQMFVGNSAGWKGATVHYSMLKRLSRSNGDLAKALEPVKEFFASKSPAVVKAEDGKSGHRRGAKATKEVAEAPVSSEGATASGGSPAPVTTPVVPSAATSALPASPTASGTSHP
jgi:hypothetical protein